MPCGAAGRREGTDALGARPSPRRPYGLSRAGASCANAACGGTACSCGGANGWAKWSGECRSATQSPTGTSLGTSDSAGRGRRGGCGGGGGGFGGGGTAGRCDRAGGTRGDSSRGRVGWTTTAPTAPRGGGACAGGACGGSARGGSSGRAADGLHAQAEAQAAAPVASRAAGR